MTLLDLEYLLDIFPLYFQTITSKVQLEAANKDESIDVKIQNLQCP